MLMMVMLHIVSRTCSLTHRKNTKWIVVTQSCTQISHDRKISGSQTKNVIKK